MIDTPTSKARQVPALCTRSPAKINLTLDVLGRRADGFHDIRSLVLGVDLNDDIRFERANAGAIELVCNDAHLPTDLGNLIVKAARALARHAPDHAPGARINLTKRIPVASGLGGGSSNAATTLTTLNELWGIHLSADDLSSIGARVGSDVPLFFALPSAVVSGRGEIVRPVHLRGSGWVLLVFAGCRVSTPDVYAAWSPGHTSIRDEDRLPAMAGAETADEMASLCSNDLEPSVFRVAPPVQSLLESVRACGAPHARVSGAGRTVFVLFDDPEEADLFRLKLRSSHIGTGARVVKTLNAPPTIS